MPEVIGKFSNDTGSLPWAEIVRRAQENQLPVRRIARPSWDAWTEWFVGFNGWRYHMPKGSRTVTWWNFDHLGRWRIFSYRAGKRWHVQSPEGQYLGTFGEWQQAVGFVRREAAK
jgi:hypothetical protein